MERSVIVTKESLPALFQRIFDLKSEFSSVSIRDIFAENLLEVDKILEKYPFYETVPISSHTLNVTLLGEDPLQPNRIEENGVILTGDLYELHPTPHNLFVEDKRIAFWNWNKSVGFFIEIGDIVHFRTGRGIIYIQKNDQEKPYFCLWA